MVSNKIYVVCCWLYYHRYLIYIIRIIGIDFFFSLIVYTCWDQYLFNAMWAKPFYKKCWITRFYIKAKIVLTSYDLRKRSRYHLKKKKSVWLVCYLDCSGCKEGSGKTGQPGIILCFTSKLPTFFSLMLETQTRVESNDKSLKIWY